MSYFSVRKYADKSWFNCPYLCDMVYQIDIARETEK